MQKNYQHCKLKFTNYLETIISAGEINNKRNATNCKKLYALVNVSADVFDILSDTDNFDTAVQAVNNAHQTNKYSL